MFGFRYLRRPSGASVIRFCELSLRLLLRRKCRGRGSRISIIEVRVDGFLNRPGTRKVGCAQHNVRETTHGGYSGFISRRLRFDTRLLCLTLGDSVDFGLLDFRLWRRARLLSLFRFRLGIGTLLIALCGI